MLSKKTLFILIMLVCAALLIPILSIHSDAATTGVTGVTGIEASCDDADSFVESNGTITITRKGNFTSRRQAHITITNTSGSTATISFDYTFSAYDSGETYLDYKGNDQHNPSSASGTYSILLTAGASTVVRISSRSFTGNTTVTATLKNFKVETAAAESNVTVTYGSLGSVKLDGTAVASGSVNAVSSSTGGTFVAVPGSGSKFVAWINPASNAVLSTSATYQVIPTEDMAIRAVFANASAAPVFFADGTAKVFESLDAALSYVSSASNKTITLASDATLAAGNYTIPAGITLNIPYNAAGTLCTTRPSTAENYTTPSVFRTLKMANGANLTVNGSLSLSAQVSCKYGHNAMPYGDLPFIKMESGSKITVESGAFLYAWGYITGAGSVEIKGGGTVYECFQVADYRGGDATSNIVSADSIFGQGNASKYSVFPFNQYYVQNVEVPMKLYAGAKENAYFTVAVTLADIQHVDVPFVAPENAMFTITDGHVVKDYAEGTGRTEIKIYGSLSVSSISLTMKVLTIGSVTIDSSQYALPIPHHFSVSAESGSVTLNQSLALLPGSELYIREGATCTLGTGKKIVVYDLDQWLYNNGANGYSGTGNSPYVKAKYVPGGDGIEGRLKDALVQVDGTVNATAGAIYVTSGGANIYSTGTGVINATPGTDTKINQVITSGTDVSSWPEIAIQPAILQDADGTDVSADVAGEYKYYASTGKWDKPGHRYDTGVVTDPTCTTDGVKTYTCTACGGTKTEAVAAKGHTEVVDAAVSPTCTETGLTEGKHCSVCGTVTVAQTEIPALGHTEVINAAVAPTCTETGLTEGKHCSVCNEVLVAQTVVAALGHGYDEGVVTTAPTCTAEGVKTYTCGTCGETKTDSIAKLPHTYVDDSVICTVCELFAFHATNVHLGNNLDMLFAFPQAGLQGVTAEELAECYVQIVRTYSMDKNSVIKDPETIRVPITQWYTYEGYYVVVYSGFAAKEMRDTITLTVCDGSGKALSVSQTDSLRAYSLRMLGDSATTAAQKTVIKDMLNYGAACQTHFQYGVNQPLANADLANYPGSASGDLTLGSGTKPNTAFWKASELVTDSNISFRIALADDALSGATHVSYAFTGHKGNKVTHEQTKIAITNAITIKEMVVADADCVIQVTIYYNDGTTKSFEESIADYVMRMNTATADPVYTEFLKFARSSYAYKHPQEATT